MGKIWNSIKDIFQPRYMEEDVERYMTIYSNLVVSANKFQEIDIEMRRGEDNIFDERLEVSASVVSSELKTYKEKVPKSLRIRLDSSCVRINIDSLEKKLKAVQS